LMVNDIDEVSEGDKVSRKAMGRRQLIKK
jgi:hypothetical protein